MYLRTFFGFIGISDAEVFKTEGTMLPGFKDENMLLATEEIEATIA